MLATAIHAGLKATQLKDLDLAYAPPYSSAKDPVNMAGFMIDNIAKGTLKQWHLEDMDKISKDKNVVLLDERCDVDAEGIVAVSPLASLLAIDADNRLADSAQRCDH